MAKESSLWSRTMPTSVVQLQEVVTTATGDQRRVEIGNAVENVSVQTLTQTAPVRTLSDVLAARVPGVISTIRSPSSTRVVVRLIPSGKIRSAPERK